MTAITEIPSKKHRIPIGVFALYVFAAATIHACVMIPVPATLEEIETPEAGTELLLMRGERVAVVGGIEVRDKDENLVCVRDGIGQAMESSGAHLMSDDTFQEQFHPWFDDVRRPRSLEELAIVMRDPIVQQRIALHGLRYLITMRVDTSEGELEGPAIPHLIGGVASYDRRTDVWALLWDLRSATSAGEVRIKASGSGTFMGYGFYGMWTIPRTESAACRALGQVLGALFTGRELPRVVESSTPLQDPVESDPEWSR